MEEHDDSVTPNHLDSGNMQYGCKHYRRRCKIRAPCCNLVFTCRHCHNEAAGSLIIVKDRHELVRRDVKQVICSVCDTEQEVARVCSKCGITFGEYYCEVCKLYDDDVTKKQFHCEECGICRVGGRENFFHCGKCGSCYAIDLRDNHSCVENCMKNDCPICSEYLFDSLKSTKKLKCGHIIHMACWFEMWKHDESRCPTCLKSMYNMSTKWNLRKEEIEDTPMPQGLDYEILILCSDCNNTSKVLHHIFGHECVHCNSFNTRRIEPDTHH